MNQETFQIFLWVMSAVALVVFIALYFVKAGYGMFRTASWGISINNKLAWVLMEAPVFILMFGLWGKSPPGCCLVALSPGQQAARRRSTACRGCTARSPKRFWEICGPMPYHCTCGKP